MTTRSRRMAAVDRTWLGHSSVMLATPLDQADPAEVRAALREHLVRHPDAPLASRIDERAGRWLSVGPAQREAHLDRVLAAAPDPEPTDAGLEAHIAAHLHRRAPDLPMTAVTTPRTLLVHLAHPVGDASTLSRVVAALARADAAGLDALADRVATMPFARASACGRTGGHGSRTSATPPSRPRASPFRRAPRVRPSRRP